MSEYEAGCVTCETRGPKWCDEHAHLLIAPDPARVPGTSEGEGA